MPAALLRARMIALDELGIMADDLTGACDVAACFARRLSRVRVAIDARHAPRLLLDERRIPIVLNTQSRNLSRRRSRARLSRVASSWKDGKVIFKKIDAALRGPVGAELEGLSRVLVGWDIVIAPALPSIGRTTENGLQLDRGTPIHLTDYAADPISPILTSDVSTAVRSTGSVRFTVEDARTAEDLRIIVTERSKGKKVIFVGSLGLADAVAEDVGRALAGSAAGPESVPSGQHTRRRPAARVLVVCGSLYPRAAAQLQVAVDRRQAALYALWPDVSAPGFRAQDNDHPSIVKLDPGAGPDPGATSGWNARRHMSSFFQVLARAVKSFSPQAIAMIGGETAYQLLTRLGTRSLEVHGRAEDVISFGIIVDGALAGIPFSMKGGSVGTENAVVAMIDLLRAGECDR